MARGITTQLAAAAAAAVSIKTVLVEALDKLW